MSLARLPATLQIVCAWSHGHLHCFYIPGKEYGSVYLGGIPFDVDAHHVSLAARTEDVVGYYGGARIEKIQHIFSALSPAPRRISHG